MRAEEKDGSELGSERGAGLTRALASGERFHLLLSLNLYLFLGPRKATDKVSQPEEPGPCLAMSSAAGGCL